MLRPQSARPAPPVRQFESAKTTSPVAARDRHVYDALLVATLDPAVRAIAPADPVTIVLEGLTLPHVPDVRLVTDGGAVVVDICHAARVVVGRGRFEAAAAAFAAQGVAYERREPPTAFGSPVLMNARSVWACRKTAVAAADQVRILALLRNLDPAPLAEVARSVHEADGVAVVLALACRDLVELDLAAGPLGPETPVRRRRRPR
jgi:hypothetical protein